MTTPSVQAPTRLRAARVLRAHGLRGEVRVEPFGGDARRFVTGLRLSVEGDPRELTVRSSRPGTGGTVLLGFGGIDSATSAQALQGAYLCVDARAARELKAGEWFVWQLVGLRVLSVGGAELGIVDDIEPAVGNDVLVVRNADAVRRFPMVHEFVRAIDVDAGILTVDPWEEIDA